MTRAFALSVSASLDLLGRGELISCTVACLRLVTAFAFRTATVVAPQRDRSTWIRDWPTGAEIIYMLSSITLSLSWKTFSMAASLTQYIPMQMGMRVQVLTYAILDQWTFECRRF